MLPEYILEEDEKIIISSKLGMGMFVFFLVFFIFLTVIWTVLMCFYIFEHETEALLLSIMLLPFPILLLELLLAQIDKKIFLTNKNVIIEKYGRFQKIKLEDITYLKGFFPPRGGVEMLEVRFLDKKRIIFVNINGIEIEEKFKELCPSYHEPKQDWDKKAWGLAIIILIMIFIPLIIAVYSISK